MKYLIKSNYRKGLRKLDLTLLSCQPYTTEIACIGRLYRNGMLGIQRSELNDCIHIVDISILTRQSEY